MQSVCSLLCERLKRTVISLTAAAAQQHRQDCSAPPAARCSCTRSRQTMSSALLTGERTRHAHLINYVSAEISVHSSQPFDLGRGNETRCTGAKRDSAGVEGGTEPTEVQPASFTHSCIGGGAFLLYMKMEIVSLPSCYHIIQNKPTWK